MKRLTLVLGVLAAAAAASFSVPGGLTRVEARRAGVRLVTREVSLGRVRAARPRTLTAARARLTPQSPTTP